MPPAGDGDAPTGLPRLAPDGQCDPMPESLVCARKAAATAATSAAARTMTALADQRRIPAPVAAPASMAATEPSLGCSLAPGPRAGRLSAASPVRVSVSTVVVRSATPRWRTVL